MSEEESRFFEERATKSSFSVQMIDGITFKGRNLAVEADSIAWNDLETGETLHAAGHEVRHIVFVSRWRGFGDGLVTGFAIGASVGGLLGFWGGEDCGNGGSEICISRGAGAFIGVVLVGTPSALVGALVGSGRGSRDFYYPSTSDSLPSFYDLPVRK